MCDRDSDGLNLLLLTQVHHDRKAQVQMLEDAIDHRIAAREKAIAQKQVKLINAIRTAFNQPVVEMGDLNEMFSAFFSAYTPIYEPKN